MAEIWVGYYRSHVLASLPKELLLEIIYRVALDPSELYPTSLIELSRTCRHLYHLIHHSAWASALWPRVFRARFDTDALYRRQLHRGYNYKDALRRRCAALAACHRLSQGDFHNLNIIDWEAIWSMISEHDERNVGHLVNHQVGPAAGAAFQLGRLCDRSYPVILPILSCLVNYDFSLSRFFTSPNSLVSQPLGQLAHDFEADTLLNDNDLITYGHDPLSSAFHLFFTTVFACHPALYTAIPQCAPIPLFPLSSQAMDVEFLRRQKKSLYPDHFVSEATQIEGDWMGYYSFKDDDADDDWWLDGPLRLTLRVVPFDENELIIESSRDAPFPWCHLRACPLTRFEGSGMDTVGAFTVTGLVDDTEDGQVTWEKTYVESGETWEYSGRFILPMGLCGRWGDEQYGGPWWIWKIGDTNTSSITSSSSSSLFTPPATTTGPTSTPTTATLTASTALITATPTLSK
ncbi:hypothetical protein BCR43DRAFT_383397 [Syncephalastrum racemosum]|uniref:F-box domain-containing protein n=1 Tax=Syncephalastrum racemosum TaxID=13706 RepID=A0A1X2H6Q5_SYNRA|nr:hypothetical protein BCR43DRAFT_383397 [Syncephalastrum racemosum]